MERENIPDWQDQHHDYMQNELDSESLFRFNSLSDNRNEKEYEDFFFLNGVKSPGKFLDDDLANQNELELQDYSQPNFSKTNSGSSSKKSTLEYGSVLLPSCSQESLLHQGADWYPHHHHHSHHHHHHDESHFMEEDLGKNGSVEPTFSSCRAYHMQEEKSLRKKSSAIREEKLFCNCEKSKCLKMYCNCYRAGNACSERCRCRQCYNTPVNQKNIQSSKLESQRIAEEAYQGSSEIYCSCRRSFCEKSYCPCLRNKTGCSPKCKCFHCKNTFGPKEEFHPLPFVNLGIKCN